MWTEKTNERILEKAKTIMEHLLVIIKKRKLFVFRNVMRKESPCLEKDKT
jgi:hypothetical protein